MTRRRSLDGARIVITGALGGIGATARAALEHEGARVVGIDLAAADNVVAADVGDAHAIRAAVERAAQELGGIDIVINNAGIGRAHDSGAFPDDAARAVMDVNFFGAWNTTAAAMPYLLASTGHVVNVASGLAFVDMPYAAAYSASKRALTAYSTALRLEYRDRITVSTVYPGYVRTAIHDVAAATGASLDGLVRADTLAGAAAAIVRACVHRPRAVSSSRLSAIEFWLARHFPATTERVIARRYRRWLRTHPPPNFASSTTP